MQYRCPRKSGPTHRWVNYCAWFDHRRSTLTRRCVTSDHDLKCWFGRCFFWWPFCNIRGANRMVHHTSNGYQNTPMSCVAALPLDGMHRTHQNSSEYMALRVSRRNRAQPSKFHQSSHESILACRVN